MIKDVQAERTNGKEIIEALVVNGETRVWIPVMATKMVMISKNGDLDKVEAIRVRKFKDEKDGNL
jgi:hypothetical protein